MVAPEETVTGSTAVLLRRDDMPMIKSSSREATDKNFSEFRHGKTFSRTKKKFGPEKARKQMIAAVLSNKRKSARGKRKSSGR